MAAVHPSPKAGDRRIPAPRARSGGPARSTAAARGRALARRGRPTSAGGHTTKRDDAAWHVELFAQLSPPRREQRRSAPRAPRRQRPRLVSVDGQRHPSPHLAVHLHRHLHAVGHQQRPISDRELRCRDRTGSVGPRRRSHSSSAKCGTSGANIRTCASATSRGAPPPRRVSSLLKLGELGDRRVEAHRLHVGTHTVNGPVQQPQQVIVSGGVGDTHLAGRLVHHVAPHTLQQPLRTHHRAGLPRPVLMDRPHRHLVEPQRVGPVGGVHVVGRDRVLQRLAHLAELPDRPAARRG